jgi:hypothetical protein
VDVDGFLNDVERNMSPDELRKFAERIIKLADSIDRDWRLGLVESHFSLFSDAPKIEKDAAFLYLAATNEERRARVRENTIGADIIAIPSWNILLELFKKFIEGARVSTKSLQLISMAPDTTTLRIISRLETIGLVERSQSDTDKRVTFIELTSDGVTKVGSVLEQLCD